jgi:hypothetical protein
MDYVETIKEIQRLRMISDLAKAEKKKKVVKKISKRIMRCKIILHLFECERG